MKNTIYLILIKAHFYQYRLYSVLVYSIYDSLMVVEFNIIIDYSLQAIIGQRQRFINPKTLNNCSCYFLQSAYTSYYCYGYYNLQSFVTNTFLNKDIESPKQSTKLSNFSIENSISNQPLKDINYNGLITSTSSKTIPAKSGNPK